MSLSEVSRGPPPVPSAVAIVHRDVDAIGDGAANSGIIFIGPRTLLPARCVLAWFLHHGYSVRLEYFPDVGAAVDTYPGLPTEIAPTVLQEGEAILASTPTILDNAITPRAQSIVAPRLPLTSPFSVPRSRSNVAVGGGGNVSNFDYIISTQNNNINNINSADPLSAVIPPASHHELTVVRARGRA